MAVRIHGAEYQIKKIFSNDFAFTIPLYQRPYSWTTDEAGELLDDLLAALSKDDHVSIDDHDPYFLGSIVLIKEADRPDSQVVDGQQRLTTISILLAAMRACEDSEFGEGLREFLYEKGNPVAGTTDRYRLTVRDRDANFFRDYVQQDGGLEKLLDLDSAALPDAQKNVRDNAVLYLTELKKLGASTLQRLAQFLIQRCFLVAVSTPDLDSAYRIFSVLNERGLDLSHSDILKSETIGKIPDDQQDEYAEKWELTEEELGRDGFADLFAHIRMIYAKSKLRVSVLQGFRTAVVDKASDPMKLIDDVLIPFGDAYENVRGCDYESTARSDEVNEMLSWLNRIDNFDWMPSAILFMSRYPGNAAALIRFYTDLERLASSMLIRRTNINERIERYGKVLSAIENGDDLYVDNSPLQLKPDEVTDTRCLLEDELYRMPKVRLYVLLRLDSALSSGGASYNYPLITVEHVLPQTISDDSAWFIDFDEDDHEAWVHRLANLVLLTRRKNSRAQNFDFDKKKEKYFTGRDGTSPFHLTTQVLGESEWSPEVLERRQRELMGRLDELWRLG